MRQFDHIGIVSMEPHPGECWVPFSKVWVTNPRIHPQRIEYLRPEKLPDIDPIDVGLWKMWNIPHVAYRVDDLNRAIEGEEVIYGPFEPGDFGRIVFIHKEGAVLEYLEYSNLDLWFGQPTPWLPVGPT